MFAISIDNPVLNTSTDPFAKNSVDEMPIVASVKNLPKNVSGSSPDTRLPNNSVSLITPLFKTLNRFSCLDKT